MKRRQFLKTVPLGMAATAMPFMLGSRRAQALMQSPMLKALTNPAAESDRVLVILYLEGGNDGLNTLIPLEDPLYDVYRKNLGFTKPEEKASITFKVRDDLGFNPAMNPLEPLWKEGKMGIIQNVGIENPDLSHFRGLEIWNSASDMDQIIATGWAARYLESLNPDYPDVLPTDPIAINMGTLGSQIFQGSHSMIDIQVPDPLTFASAAFSGDEALPNTEGGIELGFMREVVNISNVYSERFGTLFANGAKSAVDYPATEFASDLQHVAWCIAAGMKTKIYFVSQVGYDTHFSQFSKDANQPGHAYLLKTLAEGLYAYQRDLEALGIADRVITMTYSEFGRRINENGDWASGTDHGTSAPHFILGNAVNGNLYGHHPDLVNLDRNQDGINEFEFRQYYSAVLGDWFGLDESLRTSILSPGRNHNPWDITFPINGKNERAHLIDPLRTAVKPGTTPASLGLSASPNPANREVRASFRCLQSGMATIQLFDSRGGLIDKKIQHVSTSTEECRFETQNLPAGAYYIHLQSGKTVETIKITVVH